MFGLTQRERVAKLLRGGARAALRGEYLPHHELLAFRLNETASAYLHTEVVAHCIYLLGALFKRACAGKHAWATREFFEEHVAYGLSEIEAEDSLAPGSTMSFVAPRLVDFDKLTGEQRAAGEHLIQSAALVEHFDPSADLSSIVEALDRACRLYFEDARQRLGVS